MYSGCTSWMGPSEWELKSLLMDGWYGASVPDGNGCPAMGCSPKSPLWNGRSCPVSHLSIPSFSSNKLQSGPQRLNWQIDLESLLTIRPFLAFPLWSASSRVGRRFKNNGLRYRSCSSGKMIKGWVGKWITGSRGRTKNAFWVFFFFFMHALLKMLVTLELIIAGGKKLIHVV